MKTNKVSLSTESSSMSAPVRLLRSALPLLALLLAANSHAAFLQYTAVLNGPNEGNASPGTGFAYFDYDTTAHTLRLDVTFTGLLGTVTASHIHAATASPFTGTAGVATTTPTFAGFPSGVTSGTYQNTLDLTLSSSWNPSYVTANGGTTATAEAALAAAIAANKSYLNIHTTSFPGGEIRGFLVQVPEPSSALLLGLAASTLVFMARRK